MMTGLNTSNSLVYVSFEPLREGHASYTHVCEVVEGLERSGWNVTLMTPQYRGKGLPSITARIFSLFNLWWRVLFTEKPDVYYARMHFAGFVIALIASLRSVPSIVEVNGPYEDLYIAWPFVRRFRGLFDWMMTGQLKRAKGIISVTPGLQRYCRAKLVDKDEHVSYEVITNGANISEFLKLSELQPRRLSFESEITQPYAVFFGTFARWQGIQAILEAASSSNWPKGLNLLLAGDGAMRGSVEKYAKRYEHIRYIGRVAYNEIPYLIANAQIGFALTENIDQRGLYGAYPLKLFETLSCGIPAVVSEMDGQADVIQEGNCGILVPQGAVTDIVKAVSKLHDDPKVAMQMGNRGRALVHRKYAWSKIAERTDIFIRRIIEVPKG